MATNAGKDEEKEESLFTTDGSKNGYLHYGNEWKCPRKLAVELPYHFDPPLLSLSSTSHHKDVAHSCSLPLKWQELENGIRLCAHEQINR